MSTAKDELFDWWATTARQDAEMVVPKSIEYGSNSLEQVGRKMAQLQGGEVTKAEALELGCWVYAVGKMERWTDAVMQHRKPSVDTLVDLGVYTTMARRIREVGDWPGRREDNDREHVIPLPDPAPTGFIHVTHTSYPGCQHKNVNVHTVQPEPNAEMGAGTCLDCKREVPVKNPRGYTQNGAHE